LWVPIPSQVRGSGVKGFLERTYSILDLVDLIIFTNWVGNWGIGRRIINSIYYLGGTFKTF